MRLKRNSFRVHSATRTAECTRFTMTASSGPARARHRQRQRFSVVLVQGRSTRRSPTHTPTTGGERVGPWRRMQIQRL